jgi:hypothetical protein
MKLKEFTMCLDREDWGLIIDGLALSREQCNVRKSINSESTSDVRESEIVNLIEKIYTESQKLI